MRSHLVISLLSISVFTSIAPAVTPTYENAEVPMRDGVRLAADVYLPATGTGSWPVVLGRTPYDKSGSSASLMLSEGMIESFNRDGIAVVIEDVRGRYASEGREIAFFSDGWGSKQDGVDTLQWIRAQSWCNGKVATIGASAGGLTQVLLAGTYPEGVRGMWIGVAPYSLYTGFAYIGGVFRQELVETWLITAQWPYLENLSLYRSNPLYSDFWQTTNLAERPDSVSWPVVIGTCWYDLFLQDSIDLFSMIRHHGGGEARDSVHLLIGPYTHMTWGSSQLGEVTVPDASVPYDRWPRETDWFKYWLLDQPLPAEPPRVCYYTMGDWSEKGDAPGNEWRTAEEWPPPSKPLRLYLASGGLLSATVSGKESSLEYVYDPQNPVPTVGGQNFLTTLAGPRDQTTVETRQDVLVFTSAPLSSPIEVTGRIKALLHVSTSAPDTDFTAKVTDVYPDGRSMLIVDSIRRLRMRGSASEELEAIPGEVYELEIDLGSTSFVFNTGHRIRLAVSSSNSPRFWPNPNTGYTDWQTPSYATAEQKVYFGGDGVSYLELPVVEGYEVSPTPTRTPESPSPTPTRYAETKVPDYDASGKVDARDLLRLLDTAGSASETVDLDGDRRVTGSDLVGFGPWWMWVLQ